MPTVTLPAFCYLKSENTMKLHSCPRFKTLFLLLPFVIRESLSTDCSTWSRPFPSDDGSIRVSGWQYRRRRWLHAVASWTWDAQDETCGICRMAFDGCCPDCKLPGDDCPLIWGACNHAFHLHCILKWVNSQTPQAHCPMCRREWQFKG
ncbi:anaphase-promoting complex subunit 11 [Macadamia integrifolia]|uniref:anaphase-promoting complex subunit 11 n=1 Tax=Macadamia integrifolia TaxID=60698 RepID=UPI001C4F5359|nr:anaphase-promoting complex subunit 11 [Macadamia integrifolia]